METPDAQAHLTTRSSGSVGRQQGEPLSFAQVPGGDDKEVAAVEGGDLADVETFCEGDHASVHYLQAQRGVGGQQLGHAAVVI